jgi:DNA topoisomerase-1
MGGWGLELEKKHYASESGYILDKAIAERAAAVKKVKVTIFEEGTSTQNPPAAFTTSTLQQAASVKLKFSPKKTMDIAQKLFENGAITYHRTDSPNLSADAFNAICDISNALNLPAVEKQRMFKSKESAQEAHEAIRPTHFEQETPAGLDADQLALYQLIRTRALASQLEAASYATRRITAEADGFIFTATGKTLINAGFKALLENDDTDESASQKENPVPKLEVDQVLDVKNGKVLEKQTKAPGRYTQAGLVKKLEDAGVGRPATYAAIMENISQRGYVTIDEKSQQLTPTELGYSVIDALVNRFAFADIGYTRELESRLDQIEHGKDNYKAVVSDLNERITEELKHLPAGAAPETKPCPKCGGTMYKRKRKKDGKPFWGCANHECGNVENIVLSF